MTSSPSRPNDSSAAERAGAPRGSRPNAAFGREGPAVVVVTDRTQVPDDRDLLDVVGAALDGGARGVLVRERDLPADERSALIDAVGRLCTAHDAVLVAATPLLGGAAVAGVHLRRDDPVPDGPDRARLLVGRSCHDRAELVRACDDGLDYVTLSPVTATGSKPGYGPALGVAGLRDLVTALRTERADAPAVLALGGVDADNAGYWVEAGADGVAVMGAVMRAADPAATVCRVAEAVAEAAAAARSADR